MPSSGRHTIPTRIISSGYGNYGFCDIEFGWWSLNISSTYWPKLGFDSENGRCDIEHTDEVSTPYSNKNNLCDIE